MSIPASDVMDRAATLLNDTAKSAFTYTVQIPYLNTALDELQELLELNNIPFSNAVSAIIVVPSSSAVDIGGTTGPSLPTDLIEIQELYERPTGTSQDFLHMTRLEFLPKIVEITSSLEVWSWIDQYVSLLGANASTDVIMNYISARLSTVSSSSSTIPLFNAKSFLAYRTAALCAEFSGENKTRADSLNEDALAALDRLIGISTKGRQAIAIRHRPFMASYKMRGY